MAKTKPSQPLERSEKSNNESTSTFPLSLRDAATQWWSVTAPRDAERNVLKSVPHVNEASASNLNLRDLAKTDPFGHRVWQTSMVKLSGKNRALNEYSVERVGEPVENNLVMLHGYGAGLGFYFQNFEPLSRERGWKLYALDMLGMGNSSRPAFRVRAKDRAGKIAEAEGFFVDALEEWRKLRNLDQFTLLGHSMGGYLAVSYALKYPGHLNKLILVSPVGVPEDPHAVSAEMPDPVESTMENEFALDQETTTQTTPPANRPAARLPKRSIPGWLAWLWDSNFSPFSIVRMTGPFGPRLVANWSARRLNHLPSEDARNMHTYVYSVCTNQSGSGEYALPYLLAPGAYARSPIIRKIQEVGRQTIQPATESESAVRETGFPVVFMYGENDWMDVAGGYAAEEKLKQRALKALMTGTDEEKRRENGSARVVIVRRAGHHLYLDNPDEFNDVVREELRKTSEDGLRRQDWP